MKTGTNEKKNLLSIALVIFIVAVLAASCFLLLKKSKEGEPNSALKNILEECSTLGGGEKEDCLDSYYSIKANLELDGSQCAEIKDRTVREECMETVILKSALNTEFPELCMESQTPQSCRDSYYMSKSQEKKEELLCDNILGETLMRACHDQFYLQEAVRKGRCELLRSPFLKEECRETWIMQQVFDKNDVGLCSTLLDDEKEREECRESYYKHSIFIGEQA